MKNAIKILAVAIIPVLVGCEGGGGGGGSLNGSSDPFLEGIMFSEAVRMNGELALTGSSVNADIVTIKYANLPGYHAISVGKNLIKIDPDKTKNYSDRDYRALISHELVHTLFKQNNVPHDPYHGDTHFKGVAIRGTLTRWWHRTGPSARTGFSVVSSPCGPEWLVK